MVRLFASGSHRPGPDGGKLPASDARKTEWFFTSGRSIACVTPGFEHFFQNVQRLLLAQFVLQRQ